VNLQNAQFNDKNKHGHVLCAAIYSGEVFRTIFATIKAGFRGGIV
jgi:hypothetical protein